MASFLTENFDIKIQDLLKKIKYKDHSFYILCLHRGSTKITGNKVWKLKYNLMEALNQRAPGILTFGGAYSNHIYQTSKACKLAGIKSIGIIRGEQSELNSTLQSAQKFGMELHFVSRSEYRRRAKMDYLDSWNKKFPGYYQIPEGGTNDKAVQGTTELGNEISRLCEENEITEVALSVGTGGTMAGIIKGTSQNIYVHGFGALKGNFLKDDVAKWIFNDNQNWVIKDDQEFGGYAKWNKSLIDFINDFFVNTGIVLDPIYNGKMMYAAYNSGMLSESCMCIHTGGLQGIIGFNERFDTDLPTAE